MNSLIINEYKTLVGQEPPADFIQTWASPMVVRQKTVMDLRRELLAMQHVSDRMAAVIARRYMALTDASPTESYIRETLRQLVESGFDEPKVEAAVRASRDFRSKYVHVVEEMWQAIKEEAPTEDVTDMYTNRFINNPKYDVEALKADIQASKQCRSSDCGPPPASASGPGRAVSGREVLGAYVERPMPSTSPHVQAGSVGSATSRGGPVAPSIPAHVPALLDAFDSQFGRHMTGRELVRILPRVGQVTDIDSFVWKERDVFDRAFDRVRGLYNGYLNQTLDIYSFIGQHLAALDSDLDEYAADLVKRFVADEKYAALMGASVTSLYKERYRVDIELPDLQKILLNLMAGSVMVTEDASIAHATDTYVQQMEEYLRSVADIYNTHLDRTLEPDEEQEHKERFRSGVVDLEAVVEHVRSSVEYIDVVKALVSKLFQAGGQTATPARICKVVQAVLQPGACDRSLLGVQQMVTGMLQPSTSPAFDCPA